MVCIKTSGIIPTLLKVRFFYRTNINLVKFKILTKYLKLYILT